MQYLETMVRCDWQTNLRGCNMAMFSQVKQNQKKFTINLVLETELVLFILKEQLVLI